MADNIPNIQDLLKKNIAPTAQKLDEKMHEVRLKEKEEETERTASSASIPYVNLKGFPISPEALTQIPKEKAQAIQAVCFLLTTDQVRLGAVAPKDSAVQETLFALQERTHTKGAVYQVSPESLRVALLAYDTLPKIREIVKGVKIAKEDLEKYQKNLRTIKDIDGALKDVSITEVMTVLMAAGVQFESSDVHVEAEQDDIKVRLRLDGVLQTVATLPPEEWKKMISRIKLISGLKINVTNHPQDGRFTIFLKEGDTDVRVSTIPTAWGESVVMRILRPSSIEVKFEQLGWRAPVEKKLRREIGKPNGMILTTGPTGSGKTTTLYAILRELNQPDTKIVTLEDPIEYKLEGINQSQINPSREYTFASGLRSVLRQDPDVVMVGEIRDLETANTAIDAALTGHILLSTLHTNDAAGAIPRLISIGVNPVLIGPALNGLIGQRLVRKICTACKEEQTLDAEAFSTVEAILKEVPENSGETVAEKSTWKFWHGKGCETCGGTGYKGRVGIYEFLLMNSDIVNALKEAQTLSEYDMKAFAKAQGMVTMAQDGMLKALDGDTTVEEVLRVAGAE